MVSLAASSTREIGGYEVLARLKAGGMATLYLGRRKGAAGFSRHVAIKFVHEHLAEDADFVRMFVNEALLQSRITHPNVVHVEELGETPDGQHFLVMEYVHGCALSQLMNKLAKKGRALPIELGVFVAMQVAAGLHAAHEARDEQGKPLQVVHRDVSPDNVLLAYEGHVKLIDFGVAKMESSNKTSTGTLKGKLRYMSPEQASGRAIDRRTDVYALAVVLWEMLTMRRLFTETDQLLLLDAVRNPTIPSPRQVRPEIPPALEAVILKALAFDPAARFATTNDMRRALAEAVPAALLTEPAQLAQLLGAAMAAEIEADQQRLPSSVVSALAASRPIEVIVDPDATLATMTTTMEGLAQLDSSSRPVASDSQPSASGARPVAPAFAAPPPVAGAASAGVSGGFAASSASGVSSSGGFAAPSAPGMSSSGGFAASSASGAFGSSVSGAAPVEAPASSGRSALVAGAVVGVLVLVVAIGAYVASRGDASEVTVTPLATAPASVTPSQAPASVVEPSIVPVEPSIVPASVAPAEPVAAPVAVTPTPPEPTTVAAPPPATVAAPRPPATSAAPARPRPTADRPARTRPARPLTSEF